MPEKLLSIGIGSLMPDPNQPRRLFQTDELERLAASLKARGILCPLRVRHDAQRQSWLIILGESRWRAAKIAGLETLPCVAVDGDVSESDILSDQIIENSVRNALRPVDLARSLAKLKALKQCTSQQLSAELGISGAAITRSEALLSLPEDIQQLVDAGTVSESAAYEISRLPDGQSQRELAHAVAAGKLNRDQVAEAVRDRVGKKNVRPKASRLACQLDGGVRFTVSAEQPLTWDSFSEAIELIRKTAKKLCDSGKDLTDLARALRAS